MIEQQVMVSFNVSRPLTGDEMGDLERALAAQIEEPQVMDEDGELVDADFDVENVVVNFLLSGAPTD